MGEERFYKVVSGRYGEPIIIPEPALAVEVPSNITLVDGQGEPVSGPLQKISGFICRGKDREIVHRLSLTNAIRRLLQLPTEFKLLPSRGKMNLNRGVYRGCYKLRS